MTNPKKHPSRTKTQAKAPLTATLDLKYRSDILRMIVATLCASLSYMALAWVLGAIMSFPNPLSLLPEGEMIEVDVNPEPKENFLFRLAVLSLPLFLLGYCLLLFKVKRIHQWFEQKYYLVVSILAMVLAFAVLYIGLHAANPTYVEGTEAFNNSRDRGSATIWSFYFLESFIYNSSWLYLFLVVPMLTFGLALPSLFPKMFSRPWWRWGGMIAVMLYVLMYALETYHVFHFVFPYTWESKLDFGVVFYPSIQVYKGSALLIHDFTTNYGLYAHFLNPIFGLIGLSVSTFSGVMAVLMIVIWGLWTTALLRVLRQRLLVILCFSSMLFLPLLLGKIVTPFDPYFALFPIRLLVPSMVVGLGALYLYRPKVWLYYTIFVLLGFGVLWNPEFGLVALLAWILTLIYRELSLKRWIDFVKPILKHSLIGLGITILCFLCYGWLIRLQYGQFPDFTLLFTSITVFGKYGLMALEMPLIHPWVFVALVYVWGLCFSMVALVRQQVGSREAFIFMISVIGVGLFTYYQGRSHNWNLLSISWPALMLMGVYVQMLLDHIKTYRRDYAAWLGLGLCTAVLSFSVIDLLRHQSKLSLLHEQRSDKLKQAEEQETIESDIAWLRDSLKDISPKVYMLCSNKHQALYLNELSVPSAFNPATVDIFMRSDVERLINDLDRHTYDVFLDPNGYYYAHFERVQAALAARYDVVDHHNALLRLRKRSKEEFWPNPIMGTSLSSDVLFYRYYEQDSLYPRINDVTTTFPELKGIGLPFTFDVVIKPSPVITGASVLLSNMGDTSSSFVFMSPDAFVFQTAEDFGYRVPIEAGQWGRYTFLFDRGFTDIYLNGHLLFRYPPITPESDSQILLGRNMSNDYYFGPISEWCLSRGLVYPPK